MGETGMIVRLQQGSLDPRAEEFRPSFNLNLNLNLNPMIECQWYPPLPLPPPPPPPPPHLSTSSTRSLLLTAVDPLISHSALLSQLNSLGDIRAIQTDALRHGILTVHFFDLRHAESAFAAIRSMHFLLSSRPISAHYVIPSSNTNNSLPDPQNQGTLVIFNFDPNLSSHQLHRLFHPFGPIKELRNTPRKKNQRFIEFFDIRDASKAFKHINGKLFHGKHLVIDFHYDHPPKVPPTPTTKVPRTGRHWKGKQPKKHETRFLIKEDAILDSAPKDTRTTLMIKNIPNKYSQKLLLNMLDNHCIHSNEHIAEADDQPLSSYDFVYLPIDFNNKCNVGYGFVNMTSPEATLRLYRAFHLQHWEVFNSRKICQVTYARVQGLEALKEHFKNSKFPCEMEHYLPVVFSPPRDGRVLTEPLPIVKVGSKQQQEQQQQIPTKSDDEQVDV